MMDMREFQEKLEQLMELEAKQEKNLNNEQIPVSYTHLTLPTIA